MPLITLTRAAEIARPGSPIGAGSYWQRILDAASAKVRQLAGRQLSAASYAESGSTMPVESLDGRRAYVYYLREPTGTALTFGDFTTLKLNGVAQTAADVRIEADRIVFNAAGRVEVAYPGGWMRDATATAALEGAVVDVMEILHQRGGYAGLSGSQGESLQPEDDAYRAVIDALSPYARAVLDVVPSTQFGVSD